MNPFESLTNSVIRTVLYNEHWCDAINRRNERLKLKNLNEKNFWRTPEAKERRLNRRMLRINSEKFFMRTWWHLDNFFSEYTSVKNSLFKEPVVSTSVRREIERNKKFIAFLLALNKNVAREIHKKYIYSIKTIRLERYFMIYDNDFVNWDDEEAKGLTGENIFNLTELFEGYPPVAPISPIVIQCERLHRRFELESMWGPLTKRDNIFNLRELFGEYETELVIQEL